MYVPQELKGFDIYFPREEDVTIIIQCLEKPVIIGFGKLSTKEEELWVKAEILSYIPFNQVSNFFGVAVIAPPDKNNRIILNHLRYLVK